MLVCPDCEAAMEEALRSETQNVNFAGAALLGLAAGLATSFLWYLSVVKSGYLLGIVAIAVGWVVARATMLGGGKKRGLHVQALSVAVTCLSMLFAEYLIIRYYAVAAFKEMGYVVPAILPVSTMFNLIGLGLKEEPTTLVFWGIALWEAFAIPARRRLRRL
jgi:uncharacterized membrane protein